MIGLQELGLPTQTPYSVPINSFKDFILRLMVIIDLLEPTVVLLVRGRVGGVD